MKVENTLYGSYGSSMFIGSVLTGCYKVRIAFPFPQYPFYYSVSSDILMHFSARGPPPVAYYPLPKIYLSALPISFFLIYITYPFACKRSSSNANFPFHLSALLQCSCNEC